MQCLFDKNILFACVYYDCKMLLFIIKISLLTFKDTHTHYSDIEFCRYSLLFDVLFRQYPKLKLILLAITMTTVAAVAITFAIVAFIQLLLAAPSITQSTVAPVTADNSVMSDVMHTSDTPLVGVTPILTDNSVGSIIRDYTNTDTSPFVTYNNSTVTPIITSYNTVAAVSSAHG